MKEVIYMNYYEQINKALKSHEVYRSYHQYSIDWICDRISWCWKWKKINKNQMEELTERAVAILKR